MDAKGRALIIYRIRNRINGRCYVGKTCRTLRIRWRQHRTEARIARRNWPLYVDMRRFGFDAFEVKELARCDSSRRLNQLERKFIAESGALNGGYNQDPKARGGRWKKRLLNPGPLSDEHKRKIARSLRLFWAERRKQAV